MRTFKTTCIMLLTVFAIFMISGCQKDSVSSKQHETNQAVSASSKQSTNKNLSDQPSKPENKSQETKSTISTNTKTETTTKNSTIKNEKSNSAKSTSTVVKNQQPSSASTNSNSKTNNNSNKTANKTTKQTTTKTPEPQLTVTISILSNDLKKTILSPTKVPIKNGDALLTTMRTILKQKGIPISVRGSGASAYVEGIGDLYEFDHGPLSGWTAEKNGVKLDRSAGITTVKNGDSIQWIYTTDYTKDTK